MKTNRPFHALLFLGALATQVATASTLNVTSTADDGSPGTLRATLDAAVNGDTLNLSGVSGTIALSDGELVVEKNVTILGPGPGQLSVDGQQTSRVFYIAPGSVVTISGLTIANGYDSFMTSFGAGGGILNELASLTLSNCVVAGNSAELGGGIFNDGGYLFGESGGAATLTLIDSTVTGNFSQLGVGGGVLNVNFIGSTAEALIERSTLAGNSAPSGGGIFNSGDSASLLLNNSTVSGNTAFDGPGGGLFNNDSGTLLVNNSTLNGNDSIWEAGGGIAVISSIVQIRNTILNAGASGENIWIDPSGGDVQSFGNNLSSDSGAGFLTGTGDLINTDPLLGPLQDNGGRTFTHALLAGSPAIDSGSATDIGGFPVTHDQRGLDRPQGSANDIGAFEAEQTGPPPPPPPHEYSWSGVLRPLNADGSSVYKAASTIPVKFMLTGDDAGITDLIATLSYAKLSGSVVGTINEADTKVTGTAGNEFRYDPTAGQYIFNWSTKGLSPGAYRIFIDLGDGVERTVDVKLK